VLALSEFYRAAQSDYAVMLRPRASRHEIGLHAGLADTSLALAVDPALVRLDTMGIAPVAGSGVNGVRAAPTPARPRGRRAHRCRGGECHPAGAASHPKNRRTATDPERKTR
jgi:hypothetical protein